MLFCYEEYLVTCPTGVSLNSLQIFLAYGILRKLPPARVWRVVAFLKAPVVLFNAVNSWQEKGRVGCVFVGFLWLFFLFENSAFDSKQKVLVAGFWSSSRCDSTCNHLQNFDFCLLYSW